MGNPSGDEIGCPVIRVFNDAGNVIKTHEHTQAISKSPDEIFFVAQQIFAFKRRRPPKRD